MRCGAQVNERMLTYADVCAQANERSMAEYKRASLAAVAEC
jgi:hypothetical protein